MKSSKPKHLLVKLSKIKLLLILLSITACLQEVNVEVGQNEPQLVVEGFINNLGELRVKLSTTEDFTQIVASPVSGANLEVSEIDGPTIGLTEFSPGHYFSGNSEIIPEVGKSYQLRIVLQNGEEYISSVQTIRPPIEITSDSVELNSTVVPEEGTLGRTVYTHEVTVTLKNTPSDHYYYLSNQAWDQVQVLYDCFGTPPPPGPSICWLFRDPIVENNVTIGSNLEIGAEEYSILAETVPFDGRREFIALITVNSISAENYAFWQDVNTQLSRENGIFDRPFAPIVGNIRGVNTNKVALGYFQAYGTSFQAVCFDRFEIPAVFVYPLAPCNFSCRDFYGRERTTDLDLAAFICE